MASKVSAGAKVQAERCLATGAATRVCSIIPVFFERLGNQSDAFPAVQAVEASWRELNGLGVEPGPRRDALSAVDGLLVRASRAGSPSGLAVTHALGAVRALVSECAPERGGHSRVAGEALAAALEFDACGVKPPDDHSSWAEFELRGEAALAARIFETPFELGQNELFNLRVAAGSGATEYVDALERWIGS